MPVIINEFEVVTDDQSPPASVSKLTEAVTPVETPAKPLSPSQLADILCHQAARQLRIRAD